MLVDETPDISSDKKNFLIVFPTDVLLVREEKSYVSLYLRNTDTRFVSVSSGVLSLVFPEKVDYAELFTKACQTTDSTQRVALLR